jgi:hypothetical protein
MPDQTVPTPEPHPVRPLAPSARRALAGAMIATAAGGSGAGLLSAVTAVDVLDAVSWAVLGTTGCAPIEARAVLAALWTTEPTAGR